MIDALDTLVELAGGGTDTRPGELQLHVARRVRDADPDRHRSTSAGTGNAANNILNGNVGNNQLDGGAGADTMFGGLGNDTYIIDNALDRATEVSANGGIDTVRSSVTFAIAANVENLVLTGSSAINGIGNGLDNAITGNGAEQRPDRRPRRRHAQRQWRQRHLPLHRHRRVHVRRRATRSLSSMRGDMIDLSLIDANANTAGFNDAFTFIGAGAFSNVAGAAARHRLRQRLDGRGRHQWRRASPTWCIGVTTLGGYAAGRRRLHSVSRVPGRARPPHSTRVDAGAAEAGLGGATVLVPSGPPIAMARVSGFSTAASNPSRTASSADQATQKS